MHLKNYEITMIFDSFLKKRTLWLARSYQHCQRSCNLRSRIALEENKMKDQDLGTILPPLHMAVSAASLLGFVCCFFFFNTHKGCREQLWSSWLNSCITQTTQFHPGTLAHNVTACDQITRACWIAESPYMETSCSFFRSSLSVALPVLDLWYHNGL